MVSSPEDLDEEDRLDVAAERVNLERALDARNLLRDGLASLEWLPDGRLTSLQRKLRTSNFHIFHFIGHGGYDEDREESVLLLEDDDHRSLAVGGVDLGMCLRDDPQLRLVVLNACEAGRTSETDPFSGVATTLVEDQIPAVIAMQFEITDAAAITFGSA